MADEPIPPEPRSLRGFWAAYKHVIMPLASALLSATLASVLTYLGVPPQIVEVVKEIRVAEEPTEPAPVAADARFAQGWVNDQDAVRAVSQTLRFPVFANTPAGAVEEVPDSYYCWDLAKAALGRHVPTRDQKSVGSCVAFGSACAVEYGICAQIVTANRAGQPPPEFKDVAQEIIYGGSRVQIGGGRIRGDGSVGAWAAQWVQKYGSVARGKYDGYDLSAYSESTCRRMGDAGCPRPLEPEAKKYPTRSISQVRTTAEAKKALASGYPVTIASDVGFGSRGPYTRNAKGQLRASGSWAHQMCLIGYDRDSGFYCMNSWGENWVGGPPGPGNPPPGGFYIEEGTVQRMLSQNDSWAYGDQVGFPSRRIDWLIRKADNMFVHVDIFSARVRRLR